MSNMSLEQWKAVSEVAEHVAKIVAIVVAGLWTYRLFVRQRQNRTRASLSQVVETFELSPRLWLLRVAVDVENAGNVVITPPWARIAVQRMLPAGQDLLAAIGDGQKPWTEGSTEVEWPTTRIRNFDLRDEEWELEPKERERLLADFVLPREDRLVQVHSMLFESEAPDTKRAQRLRQQSGDPDEGERMDENEITDGALPTFWEVTTVVRLG